jgi:hypothetical protein
MHGIESNVAAYDVDIPFEQFIKHIRKASEHLAYYPRSSSLVEHRSMGTGSGNVCVAEMYGPSDNNICRMYTEDVLGVEEVPGANLLFTYVRRTGTAQSANAISWCADDALGSRRIERLMLRVNANANIVFESSCCRGHIMRHVYILLSDLDRVTDASKRDFERTLDNTVQAVLIGACLKMAPKTPGLDVVSAIDGGGRVGIQGVCNASWNGCVRSSPSGG